MLIKNMISSFEAFGLSLINLFNFFMQSLFIYFFNKIMWYLIAKIANTIRKEKPTGYTKTHNNSIASILYIKNKNIKYEKRRYIVVDFIPFIIE